MDDPWGNAWADPANSLQNDSKSPSPPHWTKASGHDVQEADIGMPSWSTETGTHWDEPSNHSNLWSQPTDAQEAWEPSPYERLPLGKGGSPLDIPRVPRPELDIESEPISPVPSVEIQNTQVAVTHLKSPSPPKTPRLAIPSPPRSPDAFGVFESGLYSEGSLGRTEDDPWAPAGSTSDSWGDATWGVPGPDEEVRQDANESQKDEWETALMRKEKQDSQIVRSMSSISFQVLRYTLAP
jgi:hypothetical protein